MFCYLTVRLAEMFNIIILGITSLLTDISSEMVYPILPIFLVNTLGASPAVLGVIEGIAESLASLLKVFSGYFSDKMRSRKPFTILGYSASTVGKFFLFFSANWGQVLIGRIIDRTGKGIRTSPRDALISESAKEGGKGKAFGLHRTMDTMGATIGVLLAFLGVAFLFLVREKRAGGKMPARRLRFQWKTLDKKLKAFLIFSFIFTLGNSSNQFLLLRAQQAGNPLAVVILFYLVYNLVYVLTSYPAGWLSDKIGRRKILVIGYFFYGIVYLGFAVNNSAQAYWLLFGMYGIYMGFTEGVEKALITDISSPDLRATTLGTHAMLVGIGLFPASFLAGVLWKYLGMSSPFYFGGVMGVAASIGVWFVLKEN
jgi:MFS family permease